MSTTGERIKAARISAGMTQTELANKIGVKYSAVHKYESGIVVQKYTSRAGIQHYRFHDLRHLNTTAQLLLGIDNKAIIKRNGWSTDAMIRAVYGHTSDERIVLAADVIDDYFSSEICKNANENANAISETK